MIVQFILYVADQEKSKTFYSQVLKKVPILHVPGMTEFSLSAECKLGLMPNEGIAKILGNKLPHPHEGTGIPRCEMYLYVDDLELVFQLAKKVGAKLISEIAPRDWGDKVCYFADPDGHVLAFAEKG